MSTKFHWVGIDIGGANIKIAHEDGRAWSSTFPLWKYPDRLGAEIGRLLEPIDNLDAVAVTMTGEMADCYATREEGVCRILDQLTSVFPAGRVRVYAVGGEWMSVSAAARSAWQVAASNWHALAQYVLRFTQSKPTLLVDIGSTTCDIIPLGKQKVATESLSDFDRLLEGELIYTGVRRTPVAAIVRHLPIRGTDCPVMAELFATTDDAYLLLGEVSPDPSDFDTADSRPRETRFAHARMARMVGEDDSGITLIEARSMAMAVANQQAELIAQGLMRGREKLGGKCQQVLLSGHGNHVVERALAKLQWSPSRIKLTELLSEEVSRSAPAFAVALLAKEQLGAIVADPILG